MEELRLSFIVGGAIAIVGVLCHGLWSIRKRNQASKNSDVEKQTMDVETDISINEDDPLLHDDDVELVMLSGDDYAKSLETGHATPSFSADVQKEQNSAQTSTDSMPSMTTTMEAASDEQVLVPVVDQTRTDDNVELQRDMSVRSEHISQELQATQHVSFSAQSDIPEPPASLLKAEDVNGAAVVKPSSKGSDERPNSSQVKKSQKQPTEVKTNKVDSKVRQEPSLGSDQIRIDFEPEPNNDEAERPELEDSSSVSDAPEQEVLVLNVRLDETDGISGAALLPMLLTLGFKFGDQDIFHRHVNSNGKGPVLFSLANMFKPGVFDIDNLENFTTQGISLFMILPIEGDAHQVFNMMHNAARKIADEFGGKVLDGRRSALNKQSLQQYVEKIREFERKRMIRR